VSPINAEVKSETAPADRSRCMTPLASTGMSLGHHGPVRDVSIRDDTIRLGQALKLTGLAGSGGEARALIEDDAVRVNGEVETRRGRQLRRGDVVALGSEEVRIA
jgi:ribosome-associated protein